MKRLLLLSALLVGIHVWAADVVWFDGTGPVTYQVVGKTDPVVMQALQMFKGDMRLVTGMEPVASRKAVIRIEQGRGTDDGFSLSVSPEGQIVVHGHNGRGTAYALLELSRMAGVSPWVWWGDVRPHTQSRLTISSDFRLEHTPSVQYRGIFINDEDWSLRQWSAQTFEPESPMGPKTNKALFQLLLRLRGNTIWPAMHTGTRGFFTIAGNKAMADSFGIVIGTSHCEPLLRNNVAEWDHVLRGPYNYITNREQVQNYWIERLKEVKGSEELFTIGMRGIHDGSMEGVKTKEEKLSALQQVIDDQRELIRKYYNKDVEKVPQVFIPYKEVLEIMESGLKVPDDVTLMWCDDNYGYLTRLPDAAQQQRQGGGGVYYHLSYWGRPHDYLWLTTTQPGLIYSEMKTAYDNNCRRLWIANVHDPKVAAYDLELFMDMAWDIDGVNPSTLCQHLEHWLCTQFGYVVGKAIAPSMIEFYRLNAIRKPEFMGWTQVELDKKKVPGGKSVPTTTEFTLKEAYERMADFAKVEAVVDVYRPLVMEDRRDAYFAHVLYPVHAAAAMTRKMLLGDAAESRRAYEEIQALTERYNSMNGGKWQGLMSAAPRALPVFGEVSTQLPQHLSTGRFVAGNACDYKPETSNLKPETSNLKPETLNLKPETSNLKPETSNLKPETIQMLGHSMQAVTLPKGCTLTYEFTAPYECDALLYTAMIPTHPLCPPARGGLSEGLRGGSPPARGGLSEKTEGREGNLRYCVGVDDAAFVHSDTISLKEPFRSERWKQNVLRGQALRKTPVHLTEGTHLLYVKALDDHLIFDQWMIDFSGSREFYVIPAK